MPEFGMRRGGGGGRYGSGGGGASRGGGRGGRGRGQDDYLDPESEQFRKLFIGGLSYETTEDGLKGHFEKWGEIVDCVVMKDPNTKRSRGFGFVTFKESSMLDEAQKNRPHSIDGREVEAKRAMPRAESGRSDSQASIKKMFIGGMKEDTTDDHIRDVFSQFGNIESIDIIKDKSTGKPKGFGFVLFDDYDPVDKCVLICKHELNGKSVDVKKAQAKDAGGRGGSRGGGGGRGGGRGDYGGGSNYGSSGYSGGSGYGGGGYGGQSGGGYGGGSGYGGGNSWGNQGGGSYDNNYAAGYQQQGGTGGNWGGEGNFGSGYGNSYGGGTMKGGNYSQRDAGPYGSGYGGSGGGASNYGGGGGGGGYGGGSGGGGGYNRH